MSHRAKDVHWDEREAGPLPALARCGRDVRIRARQLEIEPGVELGDGVVLVGDDVRLGAGTVIGAGCDLRAGELDIGPACDIGVGGRVWVADRFELGQAGRIDELAQITCRRFHAGKLFFVGDHFIVGGGGTMASTATLSIGDRVALGSYCVLNATMRIVLGDAVGSGDYVSLWTSGGHFGHSIVDGYVPAFAPILIEENVWLAYHATVLPGVTIGRDTIVAAGALVTRDLEAGWLAAGVPAQPRRRLEPPLPTERQLATTITTLLDDWARELAWKGWRVAGWAETLDGRATEVVAGDGRKRRVVLLARGRAPSLAGAAIPTVLVSIDDRPDLAVDGGDAALFELRARRHRGASFEVAEDLRDFMRRRTIPCGDDRLFRSIVPERFERLRTMR